MINIYGLWAAGIGRLWTRQLQQ